jgi:hypothetical protein
MKRMNTQAEREAQEIRHRQADLITRAQALSAGLTDDALRHRLRVGGPWRAVLPGVYHAQTGSLSAAQREIATVLYAGPDCVITGQAALEYQGVSASGCEFVDVLIPHSRRLMSVGFVRTHRTILMPERPVVRSGIRWAPAARAVADAARSGLGEREVRALVADSVQRRACTIGQLGTELRSGPHRGSRALRAALEEVADGVASAAEGDLRRLIKSGRLPEPMYNPSLYLGSEFLGRPDVWWRDAGVAGEVDSREWHLSPEQWNRSMVRHDKLSAQGIIVLHFTPRRIRSEGPKVIEDLRSAIEAGQRRPVLPIRTVPS